jgi:hypothetical protein
MSTAYAEFLASGSEYAVHLGDSIPHMATMPAGCVDFTVFSPPFPSLYSYTSEGADIGNSEDLRAEAKLHLSFFYRQLVRVLKPGRAAVVHVTQIPRMKRVGGQGLNDFRGLNIRLAERAGLVFEYDWVVRVNPQEQALRTKSRELQFAGLEADRAKSRGALCDYLLKFTAPGENKVPVDSKDQVSRNDWIKWAEGCWTDVIRNDTLNTAEGKEDDHVRHICPLQLEVIRRCVLLYSNPGELVFSPFTGIGSEGFVSLGGKSPKTGLRVADPRRFYGCELSPKYHAVALLNLERAVKGRRKEQRSILDLEPEAAL